MKVEVIEVTAEDLLIGDEWHMDEWGVELVQGPGGKTRNERRIINSESGVVWKVIDTPFESSNKLFWDGFKDNCIVVPVSYMDGARGSRLFAPLDKIVIRRDVAQKAA
jgi:hypothetical protein